MLPKLSIGIPSYNRPDELLSIATSVIGQIQNLDITDEVEVIICDNSDSVNPSLSSLNTIPYFRYIHNGFNIGQAKNVNKLFHEASGEFVWILADDDSIADSAICEILLFLSSSEISISNAGFITFYTGDTQSQNLWIDPKLTGNIIPSDLFLNTSWRHPIFISNNILRRSLILDLIRDHHLQSNINDTYQNSVLSFSSIMLTTHVGVIHSTLVFDSWRSKFYGLSQGFRVKIVDLMKLHSFLSKFPSNSTWLEQFAAEIMRSAFVWGFVLNRLAIIREEKIRHTIPIKQHKISRRYKIILHTIRMLRVRFFWEIAYLITRAIKPNIAKNIDGLVTNYLAQLKLDLEMQTYD